MHRKINLEAASCIKRLIGSKQSKTNFVSVIFFVENNKSDSLRHNTNGEWNMLRRPVPMLKNNPNQLHEDLYDLTLMRGIKLEHLAKLKEALWLPLITIDSLTALPEHPDLKIVLEILADRMKELASEALAEDCIRFVMDAEEAHSGYAKGQVAENYLQISAITNFYLGRYEEALKYLDVLSYVFFVNHHGETDFKCGHFSMLAGMACMQLNLPEKAAMYYNRYLESRVGIRHQPEELLPVLNFLVETRQLNMHDYGLISHLNSMQNKYSEQTDIGRALRIIAPHITKEMISSVKLAVKPDASLEIIKDLFKHIHVQPYQLKATNVHDLVMELTALKEKAKSSYDLLMADHSNKFEMDYQFKKDLSNIKQAFAAIPESLIRKMSLRDVHALFEADDFFYSGYPNMSKIFINNPDIMAAKIKTLDDFKSLFKFTRFNTNSLAEILLTETTGKHHDRLLLMVAPKFDEIVEMSGAGLYWRQNEIMRDIQVAKDKMKQESKARHKSSNNPDLLLANSVFGRKQPRDRSDVWEDIDKGMKHPRKLH